MFENNVSSQICLSNGALGCLAYKIYTLTGHEANDIICHPNTHSQLGSKLSTRQVYPDKWDDFSHVKTLKFLPAWREGEKISIPSRPTEIMYKGPYKINHELACFC